MILYCIQGSITHHTTDQYCCSCRITKQIPTFYLDANVQGIVNEEHAIQIATEIVCPFDLQYEHTSYEITATKLEIP